MSERRRFLAEVWRSGAGGAIGVPLALTALVVLVGVVATGVSLATTAHGNVFRVVGGVGILLAVFAATVMFVLRIARNVRSPAPPPRHAERDEC